MRRPYRTMLKLWTKFFYKFTSTRFGMKCFLNFYPPYFFTRTHVVSISADWLHIVVKLKKNPFTTNYVGTAFGGSLYAACDPFFMIILIHNLGLDKYIIWDKGAVIDFKKPARSTITFKFNIEASEIQRIIESAETGEKQLPEYIAEGIDEAGDVCITVKKILYVRKKKQPIISTPLNDRPTGGP